MWGEIFQQPPIRRFSIICIYILKLCNYLVENKLYFTLLYFTTLDQKKYFAPIIIKIVIGSGLQYVFIYIHTADFI